jgi:hypothetical protein
MLAVTVNGQKLENEAGMVESRPEGFWPPASVLPGKNLFHSVWLFLPDENLFHLVSASAARN